MMNAGRLTPEVICFEAVRLIEKGLGLVSTRTETACDEQRAVVVTTAGLCVDVTVFPMEVSASLGQKRAVVSIGGADRFLSLPSFSVRFLEPACAVLCNSIAPDIQGEASA